MQRDDRRRRQERELALEPLDLGLGLGELGPEQGRGPLDQLLGDTVGAAARFGEARLGAPALGVGFRRRARAFRVERADGFTDHLRRKQAGLDALDHASLHEGRGRTLAHAAGAGAADGVGASDAIAVDDVEGAAAGRAAQESREEPLGAVTVVLARQRRDRAPGALHAPPERIVDDPELRRLDHDPIARRIEEAGAPAGLGVLHEAPAIEDDAAAIELIAENAVADACVAQDGVDLPGASAGTGDAFAVQAARDCERRAALGIFGEDPRYDRGLGRIDDAFARLAVDRAITVGEPARNAALARDADHAAARLLREVHQERFGHDALQARLHRIDLAVGNRVELDAIGGRGAADEMEIGLVARQTVDRFGDDRAHAPAAHRLEERLQAFALRHRSARQSRIGEDGERSAKADARGEVFTGARLVVDRALALQVA